MSERVRWYCVPAAQPLGTREDHVPAEKLGGVLLLLLILLSLGPVSPSTLSVPSESVSDLASTALQLNQVAPGDEDWKVPLAARPLLTTFKQQLRELIGRELNGGAGAGSAEAIRARLANALAREGAPVVEADWQADNPYGRVIGLEVRRPAGLDRWLAVMVKQQITCGEDASLYFFEQREGGWRLAFDLESNGYEDVSGALGSFDFRVSPPDSQGQFFIVAVDVNPWCSSNWQRIRYRAFRPGGDPLHPQPFFQEEETTYIQFGYELSVAADRFRVSFSGYQHLDAGILIRRFSRAYRITGTQVERIGPLAEEENGFIDEWISLPWEIAGRWVVPSKRGSLRAWHGRLQEMLQKHGMDVFTQFRWWGDCGPSRFLSVLDFEWEHPLKPVPRELFFTVQRDGNDFKMERIDMTEQEGCTASP